MQLQEVLIQLLQHLEILLKQEIPQQRIQQQMDHQNQRMDKQNDLQVRMMEMAAQNDALTPEVMQEFLRQQTAQKAVDGSGGDVKKTDEYLCNSCSKSVMVGWNACPHCGMTL